MPNRPKLLLIGRYFESEESSTKIWHEFAFRLRNCGWQVLTTSNQQRRLPWLIDMGMTILKDRKQFDLAQIDLFSGHAFISAEIAAGLLQCLGKPFLLTLHGGNLPQFSQQHPTRSKRLLQKASAVIAPSRYLQQQLAHLHENIQVIPNPIDISAYPFRLRAKPCPNLVWVRAFHQIYNPSLAPKLMAELIKTWPDAKLIMIGPDKGDGSLQRMQKLAASLGVQDHIRIIGAVPREDVPKWLDQADIFINTTNVDNTPISVIEAMACGLCVVSTDVGGLPYLIGDGIDGLLVPSNEPALFSDAVERILSDHDLANTISINAFVKAKSHDWLEILSYWEDLFLHLGVSRNG